MPKPWHYAPDCPGYQPEACQCGNNGEHEPCDYCSELEYFYNNPDEVKGLTFEQFRRDCHTPPQPPQLAPWQVRDHAQQRPPSWAVWALILAFGALAAIVTHYGGHLPTDPRDPGEPPALYDYDQDETPTADQKD